MDQFTEEASRTVVLGAGKAAGSMAVGLENAWPPDASLSGLVVTRYQHGLQANRIKVLEAGHPLPDSAGAAASREMMESAMSLSEDDLLIVLLSGGGSSLLTFPAEGISVSDIRSVTAEMLSKGVSISEMNVVRKHISSILGGRLAAATKAPILGLIISDVPGDDLTHVASGPCAPDPSTYQEALAIVARYRINAPGSIKEHLNRGIRGDIEETLKPQSEVFDKVDNRILLSSRVALSAAASYFNREGIQTVILGDSVTGEATEVAKAYGALSRQILQYGEPWKKPIALISGGECTVTIKGNGRGGRCSEFLLSLGIDLAGTGVWAIACDTDGIDGSENNAGAILRPDSIERAWADGMDPKHYSANNDAWSFFDRLDDLIVTGPTRTNVNDYRAILIT